MPAASGEKVWKTVNSPLFMLHPDEGILLLTLGRVCSRKQPRSRPGQIDVIKISDLRFCERLAQCCHDVLPLFISDHRHPSNIAEVFGVELYFLPHRGRFPPMKTGHVKQHAECFMLPECPVKFRPEMLKICFG